MADYARFKRGAKTYPLTTGTGRSALRDADPFIFYLLEFFKQVLETHIGPRMLEAASNIASISKAVAHTVSFDPLPHLTSSHFKFPLLSAYRVGGKFETHTGGHRRDVSTFEVVYTLPPLSAGHAAQVLPLLMAARDVLDDRCDLGQDPTYTPSGGTAGATVWVEFAGVEKVQLTEYEVGALEGRADDQFFFSLRLKGSVSEKAGVADDTFEDYDGADAAIDLTDSLEETVVEDFVEISTSAAPTLASASPNTGAAAGGTTVTLTGTGFRVGTTPTVLFGGVPATGVTVLSDTTVQCVSPAHDAFPSFMADIELVDDAGHVARLVAGFTYTSTP